MPTRRIADLVLQSATDYGIIACDLLGRVTFWSEGAEKVLGWTGAEILGKSAELIFTDEDRANGVPQREMERALAEGRGADERWHVKRDGTKFWASGEMLPLLEDAVPIGFVKILRDRTRERLADEEILRSRARLTLAIEAGRMAAWEIDVRQSAITASPELNRLLGFPANATPSLDDIRARYVAGEDQRLRALGREALANGERFIETEFRYRWPDESIRWLLLRAEFQLDGEKKPTGVIGVLMDVTERRRAQELQTMLNHELSHRMKNQLAMVQGIVAQSIRGASSLETATKAVSERLAALSHAHDLLLSGVSSRTSVHGLIAQAAHLHQDKTDPRFRIEGPDLEVNERSALSLSLILHELATNALKYGALSSPEGRVTVHWRVTRAAQALFELAWEEMGGPKPIRPARLGFGSRLIRAGIAGAGGDVSIDYAGEGMTCVITGSLDALQRHS